MNGRDFLLLAKKLAAGPAEVEWRSAISRAYYAAFHIARSLLEDLNFAVAKTERAHLPGAASANAKDPDVESAGSDLNTLRGNRNLCDYDLNASVLQSFATMQVQLSEQIIHFLDVARQEPTRTRILDAMKTYERDILKEVTWRP